jgi:hypothetical protein
MIYLKLISVIIVFLLGGLFGYKQSEGGNLSLRLFFIFIFSWIAQCVFISVACISFLFYYLLIEFIIK